MGDLNFEPLSSQELNRLSRGRDIHAELVRKPIVVGVALDLRVDTPVGGYKGRRTRRFIMARKTYSEEFKGEAIKMVVEQRLTMSSVAKRLGVDYHTVREWVRKVKSAAAESLIPKDLPLEQRVRELEKENARLRMEREILKKATAFFAKEHP